MIEVTRVEEEKQEKNIISGYRVKGKKIIINFDKSKFGSRKFVVDKTKENEKIILNRMEEQVKELNEEKVTKEYNKNLSVSVYSVIASLFGTSFSLACLAFSVMAWPIFVLTLLSYGFLINSVIKFAKADEKMVGLTYIKNEEKINDSIAKNENILASAPKRVQKMADKKVDKPAFDINTINKLTYEELQQLLEVIERNEEFGFKVDSTPAKTLVKDMNEEKKWPWTK